MEDTQLYSIRSQNNAKNIKTTDRAGDGKYLVESMTFPSDLFGSGGAPYGGTWTMINVNVLSSSKYVKDFGGEAVDITDNEKRRFTNIDDRNASVAGQAAASGASGAVIGAAAGYKKGLGKIGENLAAGGPGQAVKGVAMEAGKGLLKGAAVGVASTIPAMVAGTAKRETKRMRAAIQLPMPNTLISSYNMGWEADSTALFDLQTRLPNTAIETIKGALTSDKQKLTSIGGELGDAAAYGALALQGGLGSNAMSALSGLASNPKKEMIFSGPEFRQFTLEYKFYPKSKEEQVKLQNILFMLRFHMHPEYKSAGRYTFVYPSEFDITFYTASGDENPWVTKIATCVLVNMTTNYTPDGLWATHDGGAPNAVSVSLTFKELSILTKEFIELGF